MSAAVTLSDPVTLRPAVVGDRNYVLSSWLRSARESDEHKAIPQTRYFDGFSKAMAELLDRSRIVVACASDDHDVIFGYLVAHPEKPVVHWVYVRETMRRERVATRLLRTVTPRFGSHASFEGDGQDETIVTSKNAPLDGTGLTFAEAARKFRLVYDPFARMA